MDAGFTAEQDEIRRTLRELLHKRCGPEELRAAVDSPAGHDPALWTALAEQLGLPGLALPESYGGVGCSATELALATEELGRLLTPSPLLATAVLTAPLILTLGTDEQRAELLPRIADGSLTAALAAPTTALALTGDNGEGWAGGGRAGGVQARRESVGGGREGGAQAGRESVEGGREGGARAGRELAGGGREGGAQAGRELAGAGRSGGAQAGRESVEGGREGGAQAGRELAGGGREGGAQAGRELAGGGREGGAQAGRAEDGAQAAGVVQARKAAGGWRLYGEIERVLDGHSAGVLLVAAHTGGFARSHTELFLVPGDADGLVRVRQTSLDSTRPLARLQLRDVKARLLGEEGADVLAELARLGDTVAAVLACEAVGAADRVLELTVEYVKQREQFGRAIGSFQAVKHRLADVYVQVQAARSAAYYAAWATAHRETTDGLAAADGGPVGGRAIAHREAVGGLAPGDREAAAGRAPAHSQTPAGPGPAQQQTVGGLGPAHSQTPAGRGPAQQQTVGGLAPAHSQTPAGPGPAQQQTAAGLAPAHLQTPTGRAPAHQQTPAGPAPAHQQTPARPAPAHQQTVGGLALAQALEALRTAAGEAIQLHGGIGFTWEHDVHLYFKRAAGDELLFGPVHRLRAHAADAARLFEVGEVTV